MSAETPNLAMLDIIERLARITDKVVDQMEADMREISEWAAALDTKLGRLAAIVADHEERLTA